MRSLARIGPLANPVPKNVRMTVAGLVTDHVRAAGLVGEANRAPRQTVRVSRGKTNLCPNGDFETTESPWSSPGTQPAPTRSNDYARYGLYSLKCGGGSGTALASVPITFAAAGTYTMVASLYIPPGWDGGYLQLSAAGLYAGSTDLYSDTMAANDTGRWVDLQLTITVVAGDLAGALRLYTSASPATTEKYVYMDGVMIVEDTIPVPFDPTAWTASQLYGDVTGQITTGYWAAMRVVMLRPATYSSAEDRYLFALGTDENNHYGVFLNALNPDRFSVRATQGGGSTAQFFDLSNLGVPAWAKYDEVTLTFYGISNDVIGLAYNDYDFVTAAHTKVPGAPTTLWLGQWPAGAYNAPAAIRWVIGGRLTSALANSASDYFHALPAAFPDPARVKSQGYDVRFAYRGTGDGSRLRVA